MPQPKKTMYRFRDRLPKNGEGKGPSAALVPTLEASDGVGHIYLYDVIDSWGGYWGTSAVEFAAALAEVGDVPTIHLHINSPGGEVYEAVAIKNLLAQHPANVVAVVDGLAASAASFIAAAANEVVMGENTELMIHDASLGAYGNAADHRAYAEDLDRVSDNIASIYAKRAGGTDAEWRQVMVDEKWYSAEEAVAAGLADRVGLEVPESADQAAARFQTALVAVGAKATSRGAAPQPTKALAPALAEPSDVITVDGNVSAAQAAAVRHQFRERAQRR